MTGQEIQERETQANAGDRWDPQPAPGRVWGQTGGETYLMTPVNQGHVQSHFLRGSPDRSLPHPGTDIS